MQQIEAYTAGGVVSGAITQTRGLRDGLDASPTIVLERATWYPIDGGVPERRSRAEIAQDDLLLVAVEADDVPAHAAWRRIVLDMGPYQVTGELPMPPGFDPGRALTRPGGAFLLLRAVRVELLGRPTLGMVERPCVLANRYAVDRVGADLDLGFFFPGAVLETLTGRPIA